jgi:hypothetical protein
MRRLALLFWFSTSLCAAGPLDAPVLPKDSAAPLVMLAERRWDAPVMANEGKSTGFLPVLSFVPEKGRGPVTLLVDLAGATPDPKGVQTAVDVKLLCFTHADACALTQEKSRLLFEGQYLVHGEAGGRATAAGRVWQRYAFPEGMGEVQLSVSLRNVANFKPERLQARVFYGVHDGKPLSGQGTRFGRVLWIALGGALVIGAAWGWVRSRG